MNNAELSIKLLLENKDVLAQLSKSVGDLQKQSKTAADSANLSWAGLASKFYLVQNAIQPVIAFMSDAVRASMEQEDAINRLNVALQAQGTFSEGLSIRYQEMAAVFQRSTRYSDEAIEGVQQQLVALGNVGPASMQRATQAVLDFSTVTGRDLNTAAMLVAKAAEGNTSALARYGIILDQNIPKSERFAAVLALIEKRFGGSAKKDAETFAGSTAQLNNAWGELMEGLGDFITKNPAVVSGLKFVTREIEALTIALKDNKPEFDNFLSGLLQAGAPGAAEAFGASLAQIANLTNTMGAGLSGALAGGGDQTRSMVEKLFLGDDPNTTTENILAYEDEIQLAVAASQDAFAEEQQQRKLDFDQQYIQSQISGEQEKIDNMRLMWTAYQDERTAGVMKQQQKESEFYAFALDTRKKADESYWATAGKLRDTFSSGMSQMFINVLKGTGSIKDGFIELGWQMIKIIVDYMVQLVVCQALSAALQSAGLAATTPIAMATALAWTPAAVMVSLATYGTNAGAAIAGMTSTMATGLAMAVLGGVAGAEDGGTIGRPGLTWVGESGPELLNLPRGAQVIPLDKGYGGINVSVIFNNPIISSREVADDIAQMIAGKVSEIIDQERARL